MLLCVNFTIIIYDSLKSSSATLYLIFIIFIIIIIIIFNYIFTKSVLFLLFNITLLSIYCYRSSIINLLSYSSI